jgi:hypothetical protein
LLWRLYSKRAAKILRQPERRALKLVGVSFILLLAYVAFDAAKTLISHKRPERSIIGILLSSSFVDRHAGAGQSEAENDGSSQQPGATRRFSTNFYLHLFVSNPARRPTS